MKVKCAVFSEELIGRRNSAICTYLCHVLNPVIVICWSVKSLWRDVSSSAVLITLNRTGRCLVKLTLFWHFSCSEPWPLFWAIRSHQYITCVITDELETMVGDNSTDGEIQMGRRRTIVRQGRTCVPCDIKEHRALISCNKKKTKKNPPLCFKPFMHEKWLWLEKWARIHAAGIH